MKQPFPIAMIPYANMAPYATMGPPEECYFVNITPRNSIAALKAGTVWAAAVPVGGLTALGDCVTPVGSFGIAARGNVMSVLFFSDQPFETFAAPRTVRLTDESASSVRLLYLLLGAANGFDHMPSLAAAGEKANGELLIGDAALYWHHAWEQDGRVKDYTVMTDLAAQWHRQHQLPFVFARWVVRNDAPPVVRQRLEEWLEHFSREEPTLIDRSVPRVAARLNLPADYVLRYLKVIRRCLTPEDLAGQARFQETWQERPANQPVTWFAS